MSGHKLPARRRAQLVDELHDAGLRVTPARLVVLDAIRRASGPTTHGELAKRLGDDWDAATIYRNLMALTQVGLVTRSDHGDRRWRFEPASEPQDHEHAHFLCTDCGLVRCLPDLDIRVRKSGAVPKAVRTGDVEYQLRGVCDRCS